MRIRLTYEEREFLRRSRSALTMDRYLRNEARAHCIALCPDCVASALPTLCPDCRMKIRVGARLRLWRGEL